MPIMTATEARKNLYRLIDTVNESHDPVHISGKRCTAVLVSERDWHCVQEALHILSQKILRESLLEGVNTPLEDCTQEDSDDPVALFYTEPARRDAKELNHAGFAEEVEQVLSVLRDDPYQMPPPFGKLMGDFHQVCCRRISIQHRLLYEVLDDGKRVKILRMCSLYDNT